MTKQLVMYGIGDASDNYRALAWDILDVRDYSVWMEKHLAQELVYSNPGIKQMFIIDNQKSLSRDFRDALRKNTMEEWLIFKDTLERYGREVKVPRIS